MLVGAIHSTMQRGAPSHPLERKESAILLTYERTSNISTVVKSSKQHLTTQHRAYATMAAPPDTRRWYTQAPNCGAESASRYSQRMCRSQYHTSHKDIARQRKSYVSTGTPQQRDLKELVFEPLRSLSHEQRHNLKHNYEQKHNSYPTKKLLAMCILRKIKSRQISMTSRSVNRNPTSSYHIKKRSTRSRAKRNYPIHLSM